MYAVVEFNKRECCVIPQIWIVENKAYWPNKVMDEKAFHLLVEEGFPPKPNWAKYDIKVHCICNNLVDANKKLDDIIAASSESSEPNSDNILNRKKIHIQINEKTETDEVDNQQTEVIHLEVVRDCALSDNDTSDTSGSRSSWISSKIDVKVLQRLETIAEEVSQNSLRSQQILRILSQNDVSQINKPDNFPVLPLNRSSVFTDLESILKNDEDAYRYLRNRLSTIGGTSVKHTTCSMMKYLLTNKLGRKFNWAGNHNKTAFKSTKCFEAIQEAVFQHFSIDQPSDLKIVNIKSAIQDWLRLAKQRYDYSLKKLAAER